MNRLEEIKECWQEDKLSELLMPKHWDDFGYLISEVETKTAQLESAMANIDKYEAENKRLREGRDKLQDEAATMAKAAKIGLELGLK